MTDGDVNSDNTELDPPAQALASPEAKPSVAVTVDSVRELVHNLADANCNGLTITSDMSRQEIQQSLDLYGFPPSILHGQGLSSWRVGKMLLGVVDNIKHLFNSPVHDAALLKEHNEAWQNIQEQNMREQTVKMNNAGEMVFVEGDGKLVGMIGIRKLGAVEWEGEDRQLYELPRFSILPGYDETTILRQLMMKGQQSILQECKNPIILVHTKRDSVRKWALRREHRSITFDDYVNIRKLSPDMLPPGLKERWEIEGWEYLEVDPLKKSREKQL